MHFFLGNLSSDFLASRFGIENEIASRGSLCISEYIGVEMDIEL